jgi:pyruvate dehydrogenase E2 component (dihydrolipoamide acetyltransferase)
VSTPVVMPALGESVSEGTLTRWLKEPGEAVSEGEPLLEVSTDKVDTEIVSPATGILTSIEVAEEATVPVGTVLATIGTLTETVDGPQQPAPPRRFVSPAVRALVRTHAVDLDLIAGTGRGSRVTRQDVLASLPKPVLAAPPAPIPPPPSPEPAQPATVTPSTPAAVPAQVAQRSRIGDRTEVLPRLRKVIAARMVESLRISAQLTTVVEVDLTRIAVLRAQYAARSAQDVPAKLSYLPFVARATCEALTAHPALNASLDPAGETVTYHTAVDLGIAVDTDRGLLVPVIRSAGDLNVVGLARRIAEIAERARASTVSADELTGGSFTITNTGSRGALFDTPIINQPQVAILGIGAVVKRAVVITGAHGEDLIAVRSMAYLSLTYDHRLVDGADAARFLTTIKARLESGGDSNDLLA